MMQHAPFPPSSAERWMSCPGSFQAEQQAGPRPSSGLADEGTIAHGIFAEALRRNLSPYRLTDDVSFAAPLHLAWLHAIQLIAGQRFLVEQRLNPLPGLPELWGTADTVTFDRHDRVRLIFDLKFGRGVVIEANAIQLAIYALLAAQQFGAAPEGVTAAIIQPRGFHIAGPVRLHHHTPAALDILLRALQAAVTAAEQSDAPRVAGTWCRFCAAAKTCPARHRMTPQQQSITTSSWLIGAMRS
jgi:hypothetical protein